MNELALYAGCGGGLLATRHLLGWQAVCYVENNPYRIAVLKQRIQDRLLDDAPIWGDARTFDGMPWAGCVDVVTAGFPCTPWSVAGPRKGKVDRRNMWPDTIRIIREVAPEWIFLENVPRLLVRYFGTILEDLAESGYDANWTVLSAAHVGAPHLRNRLWLVGHAQWAAAHPEEQGLAFGWHGPREDTGQDQEEREPGGDRSPRQVVFDGEWDKRDWSATSGLCRKAHGLANRVDRIEAIGDGQVPAVAAEVWHLLTEGVT